MRKSLLVAAILLCVTSAAYGTCQYLTFLTESLPDFTVGVYGSTTIDVWGGTAPYTFTITSGSLPPGLTMSSGGVISGTATAEADNTVFVKVTDSLGCHLTNAYPVRAYN
ncbi:MAG: putative Ig domain-containing protein [Acidobacteriota bacterium]